MGDEVMTGGPARPSSGRAVRVALLDDHEVLLDSVSSWLREHAPDLDVVLRATSWLELVHSPAFPTDLVLLDVQPQEPVSLGARIRSCRAAGAVVVVLTGLDDPELRRRALEAGAAAFLSKSRPILDLVAAVREVLGGAPQQEWRPLPAEALRRPRLSLGEESALRLYASGLSTADVAAEMHVQFETAKTYLRRVREKYARVDRPASRRSELIQRALEDGYLQ
ncbi:response regulator [Amnibacterium endophyticum]|uniref:Response regulator n=1 Tax=Amnibacterium endophyticum TaxID=2109337 RepID=A0ABW4LI76_9MICO